MPPPVQRPTSDAALLEPFLQGLLVGDLLTAAEVQSLRARSTAALRQDCRPLIKELIRTQKLTRYQASAVLQGKARELVLDNYVILDKLGEGGMGVVFRARHRKLGQVVALKVLSPAVMAKPTAVKRFLREVRAVSQLQHPNIVAASDAGESKGTHFLVMEYVEGTDLTRLVKKDGPLPVGEAIDAVLQAARGLAHAHEVGIIHRDIKPSNLLLDRQGMVKILDLGLAIQEDEDDSATQQLTKDGSILGTCDYMAPEQALNSRNADQRSDIYSLGCTLYYLLTGQVMYGGQTTMEKLMAHRESAVPALTGAPPGVQSVYQRMVAKRPEKRFQTMADVIAALEAVESGGARSATASWKPASRRWLPIAAGGAVAAVLAAFFLLPGGGERKDTAISAQTRPPVSAGLGPSNPDDPARWRNAFNLLRHVDPVRDRCTGAWKLDGGILVSDASIGAKYLLPYQPPEEYDVRVEYTRLAGKHSVMLILSQSGRPFGWEMGNQLFGFNSVDGKGRYETPGAGKPGLESGQRMTSIIQIRKQGVKAYANGVLVSELSTDYRNVGPPEYWNWWSGSRLGIGSWLSPTAFSKIEVLEVTGKGSIGRPDDPVVKDVVPKGAVDDPARWQNAVNLLALIDPAQDAGSGRWRKNDFGLVSDNAGFGKLVIPYQPPEEYDFRIIFTRQEGDRAVGQVLSKGGRCFAWEMGLFPNKACGFNMVGGLGGNHKNNPTCVPGIELTNGQRHTGIVQVRNTGVSGYLDGVLIKEYKTDFRDMDEPYPWKWPTPSCLGVGSWSGPTTFHAIEVLEVTGKGRFTRP